MQRGFEKSEYLTEDKMSFRTYDMAKYYTKADKVNMSLFLQLLIFFVSK